MSIYSIEKKIDLLQKFAKKMHFLLKKVHFLSFSQIFSFYSIFAASTIYLIEIPASSSRIFSTTKIKFF